MSLEGILTPNVNCYPAKSGVHYLSSRLVTHNGVTIAVALAKGEADSLFFAYSILNGEEESNGTKEKKAKTAEETAAEVDKLDSQCWLENVKILEFPSEIRVVGEEAVPVYTIPAIDSSGRKIMRKPDDKNQKKQLNSWLSSTACLMDPQVHEFQVLSDGRYVYLFRQSVSATALPPHPMMTQKHAGVPPVDQNLLCDRFVLVGTTLNRPLEPRYQRSRQKQIPLDGKDTLSVKDIDGISCYEPTYSLHFIRNLHGGRFCVLRVPTMVNDVSRWVIFAYSCKTCQIDCFSSEVASNGLFDLHGKLYYTCNTGKHAEDFATSPGPCTASRTDGRICGAVRVPIVPKTTGSKRSLRLNGKIQLCLDKLIKLSDFPEGFILEAWIKPELPSEESHSKDDKYVNRFFCLFPQISTDDLGISFNENLQPVICSGPLKEAVAHCKTNIDAKEWNHIAVTYHGDRKEYSLMVNGADSCTISSSSGPGQLLHFGFGTAASTDGFAGLIAEVRLWNRPLNPSTIKSNMARSVTGQEPYLEYCWSFGEESGMIAFDSGPHSNHLSIVSGTDLPLEMDLWADSAAPIVTTYGLSRRILRLESSTKVMGGLSASLYYEQVAASIQESEAEGGPKSDETMGLKYMKRSARILLCFVSGNTGSSLHLSVIDIPLLSDGMLSDTPACITMPDLTLPPTTKNDIGQSDLELSVLTALLYVGSQGKEMFGGVLAFDGALCENTAPHVLESATGSVTIYYRAKGSRKGVLSSLSYCISRTVVASSLTASVLGNHEGLLASSRLQSARMIVFQTEPCAWAPEDLAVNVILTAHMVNDETLVETWTGLPSRLADLCSLLNGTAPPEKGEEIGLVDSVEKVEMHNPTSQISSYKINLQEGLCRAISKGARLGAMMHSYIALADASVGSKELLVSLYNLPPFESDPPNQGEAVISLGYEFELLIKCKGKGAGDFRQHGSGLVTTIWSPYAIRNGKAEQAQESCIQTHGKSLLTGGGRGPSIACLPRSSALRLDGTSVYAMVQDAIETVPCPGICFESWINVENVSQDTIAVAFTSQNSPRREGLPKESQRFTLCIPKSSYDGTSYNMEGNINGSSFRISQPSALKLNHWVHIACSSRNVFALKFSGNDYVDLGKNAQWNVSDFSLSFTLMIESFGPEDQILFAKGSSHNEATPLLVKVTPFGRLQLTYWTTNVNEHLKHQFFPLHYLQAKKPYKVLITRKMIHINRKDDKPLPFQLIAIRVWDQDGQLKLNLPPFTPEELKKLLKMDSTPFTPEELNNIRVERQVPLEFCQHGAAQGNEGPLTFGGASWSNGGGLKGILGSIHLSSSAITTPDSALDLCGGKDDAKATIGSWSCREGGGSTLVNDLDRDHGKLKGDLKWVLGPYALDNALSIFVNAMRVKHELVSPSCLEQNNIIVAGPHQLTLGNAVVGNEETRFLGLAHNFCGMFDEMRIWNVPRTRENISDSLHGRLAEVPDNMAVYLSFDDAGNSPQRDDAILDDTSINCWHLSQLLGTSIERVVSGAPIGYDSPCVNHSLVSTSGQLQGVTSFSGPSVAEYGDMEVNAEGNMEGSYKRVYSYTEENGNWYLVNGFRIGSLKTEWVAQMQTKPTLIGFIEGAPPVPLESFNEQSTRPATSIQYRQNSRCINTYSSRFEHISDFNITYAGGAGINTKFNVGVGVSTEAGNERLTSTVKGSSDTTIGSFGNDIRSSTTGSNLEVEMQLTGHWDEDTQSFVPNNTGVALVESEVADLYALRLQMRGLHSPLVAYQLRPSANVPRDRNLVSFEIDPRYTKQGCLDGRRGLSNDPDYPVMSSAPKDASYYKPAEAYAIRERIQRAEEQRLAEYDQFWPGIYTREKNLPERRNRNICNSYVWNAYGGTYGMTTSILDMAQSEVGGSLNTRASIGASYDNETSILGLTATSDLDLMYTAHFNMTSTKEQTKDEGFDLDVSLPQHVSIQEKDPKTGKYVKRPGAVDQYRWMSFWLEPSVEATDIFFRKVIEPKWLAESPDPDAQILRSLREGLAKESDNARTKAWRVLHRCTYVSRVPEKIPTRPEATQIPAKIEEDKKSTLLSDVACNWVLIQKLEPFARGATSKVELANALKQPVLCLFPSLASQTQVYSQVLDLMAHYIGII